MLAWEPTDDDIEGMVIDALEALPAPFRDQLGSVAIVIEEQATREQLDLVAAHAAVRRRRPDAEQDHDLSWTARLGQPDARTPCRRSDRHRLPRDRTSLR